MLGEEGVFEQMLEIASRVLLEDKGVVVEKIARFNEESARLFEADIFTQGPRSLLVDIVDSEGLVDSIAFGALMDG